MTEWHVWAIIAMVVINVIGWAYTLGKSAGMIRSENEARDKLTEIVTSLQLKTGKLDQTTAVLASKCEAINATLHNGIADKIQQYGEDLARLEVKIDEINKRN